MDWYMLGIEPTKDKKAITAAYRQRLRQTNPEDKPEEFKLLRMAYEEAMRLADQTDSPDAREKTPVGLWIESVERVYEDFRARIDPENWKAILRSDICTALDSRSAAEEAFLNFLLEHFYLPKAVWKVIEETFSFSQRIEELYETWPKEFVDHAILAGTQLEPVLNYALFSPGISGADCDAYRRLYAQATQTLLQEIGPILEQMDQLSETHPYGEVLRCRFMTQTGNGQDGTARLESIAEKYPQDSYILSAWAEDCLNRGDVECAQSTAERVLAMNADYIGAKIILSKCLAEKKDFHRAKDLACEILRSSADDFALTEQMTELVKQWNEHLILQRQSRYAQAPEDVDNLIELAWCYAQNDRMEDAFELASRIDPNYEDAFSYHNLMGKLYHSNGKFQEALEHLQKLEEILRSMRDDGTEENRKRIARLPEMMQIQANCLMQLGRKQEAKEKLEQVVKLVPDDTEMLSLMAKILYSSGEYDQALEVLQKLLRLSPGAWLAEMLRALCLYYLHRDREAIEAVDRTLAVQNMDLSVYVLKMLILIRNGVFDGVHEILDFLEQSNAPEDISTDFIRALLLEMEKKDLSAAMKQYRILHDRVEAGEEFMWSAELYYHLAVLTGNQTDITKEEDRRTVLDMIHRGLDRNEQNTDLLSYKAWVLRRGGLQEEAIEMYRELLQKNADSTVAIRGIADIYYEDLDRYAREALEYYEQLLRFQKTPELYFYAATCRRHLADAEGARQYYLKELEMDPEDIDAFRGLALLAEGRGDYETSLQMLDRGLKIMEEYQRPYDRVVEHKAKVLRRLGQCESALSFAKEAESRYQYSESLQLQFDICCQFGLWDRAQDVLDQWKRRDRNDPRLMAACGRWNLLQGKMFKAAMAMGPAKHKLPFEEIQDFRLQLAELECNYTRMIQLLEQRVMQNPRDDHALTSLAHAYWHAGKKEAAMETARKAIEILDDMLGNSLTDEPLYRTRRCLALAILGRTEEAKAELANCRKLPLCEFCEYGSCKDADIYEAHIEEIQGNRDRAKMLYAAGRVKWPDDLDFASGEARIKKKGRK